MKRKGNRTPNVCWARVLDGCAGGISGEHVVSNALFTGSTVIAQGPPWTASPPRVIGRRRLRRRILCRGHNGQLSAVDNEAGRTFKVISELDSWLAASRRTCRGERREYRAQGPLLERWFLKTTINLFVVSGRPRTWADGSPADAPPIELASAAFGQSQLPHPRGTYSWGGFAVGVAGSAPD